jgi:hypothetical protein
MGAMRGDVAQEAEGPCLVAAFTAVPSESQRALGTRPGVVDLICEQIRLTKVLDTE